ncbi:hypothetical protein AB4242_05165 [Vibrio splendidus]
MSISHFNYSSALAKIEASYSQNGIEVAWIKNTSIEESGSVLRIRHIGVTTDLLGQSIARKFLISLIAEKECWLVRTFIFEAVDLEKKYWEKFLTKYKAINIGIDSMYPYDSYKVTVENIINA